SSTMRKCAMAIPSATRSTSDLPLRSSATRARAAERSARHAAESESSQSVADAIWRSVTPIPHRGELRHSPAAMAESRAPEKLTRRTTSLPQLFAERVQATPDREAYRYPVGEEWRSMTWRQSGERIKAIAAGLLSLGLDREDRVAILCNTRVEWLLTDLGIMAAGGATTTVYPSSTAEESAYILADSETRYAFAEDDSQLA